MFDRASIVRPLGRCRIVAGDVSIHTFSARAPSRRAIFSRFTCTAPYTRLNSQSGRVCTVRRRWRERPAARRAPKSASLFFGALAISLFISVTIRVSAVPYGVMRIEITDKNGVIVIYVLTYYVPFIL